MKSIAIASCLLVAAQAHASAAQEFDPEAQVQAAALEAKWPPIDEPSFRASLVDFLVRHPSVRFNTDRDVLPELSTSMGRFCNLPSSKRFEFVMFETVTFADEVGAQRSAKQRLRRGCGLAIYARDHDGARSYLAIYSRPRGAQPTGRTYTMQQGAVNLQVIALPVPAKPVARFQAAAKREAFQLWGTASPP